VDSLIAVIPEFLNPSGLLTPSGPYSQVARVGELVFVSGQVGADVDRVVADGIAAQCDQALRNVDAALRAVGLDLGHVAKLGIFVAHPEDLPLLVEHMDATFPGLFPDGFPASSLLVVRQLFRSELRIEIEAVAHR